MSAPSANMYWRSIPWGRGVRVSLQGKPKSRYYVVTHGRKRYTVYWMGNEAADAQRALDQAVAAKKSTRSYGKRKRSYRG